MEAASEAALSEDIVLKLVDFVAVVLVYRAVKVGLADWVRSLETGGVCRDRIDRTKLEETVMLKEVNRERANEVIAMHVKL